MEWLFCMLGMGCSHKLIAKLIATYLIDRCGGELMELINPEVTYSETWVGQRTLPLNHIDSIIPKQIKVAF